MVEERDASFQRVRHRHAVQLGQDVPGKVRPEIEILQARKGIQVLARREERGQPGSDSMSRWLEEARDDSCGKERDRVHVSLDARQREMVEIVLARSSFRQERAQPPQRGTEATVAGEPDEPPAMVDEV